jgi:chemotaxis protein methyltransferase WspC
VDISARALEAARRAVYGKASFRHPMPGLVEKYFRQTAEGFELDEQIVKLVRFRQVNLLEPFGAAAPYHAIFCRNLLMYLHDEARQSLVGRMRGFLDGEGMLFTGPSELVLFLEAGFARVAHPQSFACRKSAARQEALAIEVPARVPERREIPRPAPQLRPAPPPAPPEPEAPRGLQDARRLADRGKLEEAAAICRRLEPGAEVFCLLGLISQSANRFAEAEEWYRKALYLDPRHEEALVHMSLLCESRGDADAGARFRSRAMRAAQGGRG